MTTKAEDLLKFMQDISTGKAQIVEAYIVDSDGGATIDGKHYTEKQLAKRKKECTSKRVTLQVTDDGKVQIV